MGDAEQDFLERGLVGIYFGVGRDISRMSDAALRLEIEQVYTRRLAEGGGLGQQSRVKRVVTYYLNQVCRFRDDIRRGDTIVMPRKAFNGRRVAHGVVVGDYEYCGSDPYCHRRRVRWTEPEVPRGQIGHAWPLSDRRTVFRIGG